MDFSQALLAVKDGQRISRAGWNGAGMWVAIQRPDKNSKMTLPYLYLRSAHGQLVPYLLSQTDVLSDDWAVREVQ
jgi:hypothetical protein